MIQQKVIIIVLQFNNSRDTIRCLESVKELNWQNFEAVIVDNASEIQHLNNIRLFVESQSRTKWERAASPRDFLRDEGKNRIKFHLLTNQQNLGYAGGNNVGVKYALENGADYVLILNPDTTVEKNLLVKLAETAQKTRAGIVGPAANENDRKICCGEIEWLKPELKHSVLKTPPRRQANRPRILSPDQYIPGAAMFIDKKVFEKIGMFDEKYFLYFEDADFCTRARKVGFKLAVASDAIIHHNPSSSTSKLGAAVLLYYHYRNALLFNAKNGPLRAKILLPFWSFWIMIKQIVKILFNINPHISHAILNGVVDFYKKRLGKIYV